MKRLLVISLSLFAAACVPLSEQKPPVAEQTTSSAPSQAWEGDDLPPVATGTGIAVMERALVSGALEQGSPDAPVTLLVVTHPSCGYCRALHRQVMPEAVAPAVARGEVRVHTLMLPLQKYPQSGVQAALLHCASQQGKGTAMLDWLMTQDITDKARALKTPGIPATDLKLLTACVDDPGTAQALARQQSMIDTLGIRLVPTIVLDGTAHTGLPSGADLEAMVERALTGH